MPVLLQRQGIFPVRFVERSGAAMNGNHADLILSPFLHFRVRDRDSHVPGTFDRHRTSRLFPIDVDAEIRAEAFEVRLPPSSFSKRFPEQLPGTRIVLDAGLALVSA